MKTKLFTVATICLMLIACNSNRHFFDNKILRYSKYSGDSVFVVNSAFVDYYADTIYWVRYPFTLDDEALRAGYRVSGSTISFDQWKKGFYEQSQIPFRFVRKRDRVHLQYQWEGQLVDRPYFSLSSHDTLSGGSFSNLCYPTSPEGLARTIRKPIDTTLVVAGRKRRCWVFIELYPQSSLSPGMQYSKLIYLDKRSLLPLQLCEVFDHMQDGTKAVWRREVWRETVDSVFARPWRAGEERWRYPRCWRP